MPQRKRRRFADDWDETRWGGPRSSGDEKDFPPPLLPMDDPFSRDWPHWAEANPLHSTASPSGTLQYLFPRCACEIGLDACLCWPNEDPFHYDWPRL